MWQPTRNWHIFVEFEKFEPKGRSGIVTVAAVHDSSLSNDNIAIQSITATVDSIYHFINFTPTFWLPAGKGRGVVSCNITNAQGVVSNQCDTFQGPDSFTNVPQDATIGRLVNINHIVFTCAAPVPNGGLTCTKVFASPFRVTVTVKELNPDDSVRTQDTKFIDVQ